MRKDRVLEDMDQFEQSWPIWIVLLWVYLLGTPITDFSILFILSSAVCFWWVACDTIRFHAFKIIHDPHRSSRLPRFMLGLMFIGLTFLSEIFAA